MENDMSRDYNMQARWSEVKANFKKHFSNFSDAEVNTMDGAYDKLSAAIERKYGYNKERVRQELDNFISAQQGTSAKQATKNNQNNCGDQRHAQHGDHGSARRDDYSDRH